MCPEVKLACTTLTTAWIKVFTHNERESLLDGEISRSGTLSQPVLLFEVCVDSPPLPFFVPVLFLLLLYPVILLNDSEDSLKSLAIAWSLQSVFSLSRLHNLFISTSFLYRRGLVWAVHHCRKCFFSLIWGATALCRQQRCPWPHLMTLFSQLKLACLSIVFHVHILYSSTIFCNPPFTFFTLICPFFLFWGLVSARHFTNERHTSKRTL